MEGEAITRDELREAVYRAIMDAPEDKKNCLRTYQAMADRAIALVLSEASRVCQERKERNLNTAADACDNWDRSMLKARADADGLCADAIRALMNKETM